MEFRKNFIWYYFYCGHWLVLCGCLHVFCCRFLLLWSRLWSFAAGLWSLASGLWSFVVVCGWFVAVCRSLWSFLGDLWSFVVVVSFTNYDIIHLIKAMCFHNTILMAHLEVKVPYSRWSLSAHNFPNSGYSHKLSSTHPQKGLVYFYTKIILPML